MVREGANKAKRGSDRARGKRLKTGFQLFACSTDSADVGLLSNISRLAKLFGSVSKVANLSCLYVYFKT